MILTAPRLALAGYGLTTASILYRLPDFPAVLQSFVWQEYDVAPLFPELHRFLDFWERELDGALHSVRVAHHRMLTDGDIKAIAAEVALH